MEDGLGIDNYTIKDQFFKRTSLTIDLNEKTSRFEVIKNNAKILKLKSNNQFKEKLSPIETQTKSINSNQNCLNILHHKGKSIFENHLIDNALGTINSKEFNLITKEQNMKFKPDKTLSPNLKKLAPFNNNNKEICDFSLTSKIIENNMSKNFEIDWDSSPKRNRLIRLQIIENRKKQKLLYESNLNNFNLCVNNNDDSLKVINYQDNQTNINVNDNYNKIDDYKLYNNHILIENQEDILNENKIQKLSEDYRTFEDFVYSEKSEIENYSNKIEISKLDSSDIPIESKFSNKFNKIIKEKNINKTYSSLESYKNSHYKNTKNYNTLQISKETNLMFEPKSKKKKLYSNHSNNKELNLINDYFLTTNDLEFIGQINHNHVENEFNYPLKHRLNYNDKNNTLANKSSGTTMEDFGTQFNCEDDLKMLENLNDSINTKVKNTNKFKSISNKNRSLLKNKNFFLANLEKSPSRFLGPKNFFNTKFDGNFEREFFKMEKNKPEKFTNFILNQNININVNNMNKKNFINFNRFYNENCNLYKNSSFDKLEKEKVKRNYFLSPINKRRELKNINQASNNNFILAPHKNIYISSNKKIKISEADQIEKKKFINKIEM